MALQVQMTERSQASQGWQVTVFQKLCTTRLPHRPSQARTRRNVQGSEALETCIVSAATSEESFASVDLQECICCKECYGVYAFDLQANISISYAKTSE